MDTIKEIITITAHAGAGKSMLEEYIVQAYDFKPIHSFTTRPQRGPDDTHHRFVEPGFFQQYAPEELICHDVYGKYEYGMLLTDFEDRNVYVLEENGLVELFKRMSGEFFIHSIFLTRPYEMRLEAAGEARVKRDEGRMALPDKVYDVIIQNDTFDPQDLYASFDAFMLDKE